MRSKSTGMRVVCSRTVEKFPARTRLDVCNFIPEFGCAFEEGSIGHCWKEVGDMHT